MFNKCNSIGDVCHPEGWRYYRTSKKEFLGVLERAEDVIYTQKFEGAVVRFFNPRIIARDFEGKEISG